MRVRQRAQPPIQKPITGTEEHGDLSQAFQVLVQFYAALNARDLQAMSENWRQSAEIAMDNPLGGIKRGWNEISAIYAQLFKSPAAFRFEFYDYTIHAVGNIFYAVGRERGELLIGSERMELAIRTTRIFQRACGIWKQVHHHGSIDDPASLARYQNAVLGRTFSLDAGD